MRTYYCEKCHQFLNQRDLEIEKVGDGKFIEVCNRCGTPPKVKPPMTRQEMAEIANGVLELIDLFVEMTSDMLWNEADNEEDAQEKSAENEPESEPEPENDTEQYEQGLDPKDRWVLNLVRLQNTDKEELANRLFSDFSRLIADMTKGAAL